MPCFAICMDASATGGLAGPPASRPDRQRASSRHPGGTARRRPLAYSSIAKTPRFSPTSWAPRGPRGRGEADDANPLDRIEREAVGQLGHPQSPGPIPRGPWPVPGRRRSGSPRGRGGTVCHSSSWDDGPAHADSLASGATAWPKPATRASRSVSGRRPTGRVGCAGCPRPRCPCRDRTRARGLPRARVLSRQGHRGRGQPAHPTRPAGQQPALLDPSSPASAKRSHPEADESA